MMVTRSAAPPEPLRTRISNHHSYCDNISEDLAKNVDVFAGGGGVAVIEDNIEQTTAPAQLIAHENRLNFESCCQRRLQIRPFEDAVTGPTSSSSSPYHRLAHVMWPEWGYSGILAAASSPLPPFQRCLAQTLATGFHRFLARISGRRPFHDHSHCRHHRNDPPPWVLLALIIIPSIFSLVDACSSRTTPKPRPPVPTARPNITFHTYECPPAYATWYCLNGATCFTVKIGDSLLYNCECAEGYMGPRCEYKDLDGSYLPSQRRFMLETASIAGGATIAVFLVVILCIVTYIQYKRRTKNANHMMNGGSGGCGASGGGDNLALSSPTMERAAVDCVDGGLGRRSVPFRGPIFGPRWRTTNANAVHHNPPLLTPEHVSGDSCASALPSHQSPVASRNSHPNDDRQPSNNNYRCGVVTELVSIDRTQKHECGDDTTTSCSKSKRTLVSVLSARGSTPCTSKPYVAAGTTCALQVERYRRLPHTDDIALDLPSRTPPSSPSSPLSFSTVSRKSLTSTYSKV